MKQAVKPEEACSFHIITQTCCPDDCPSCRVLPHDLPAAWQACYTEKWNKCKSVAHPAAKIARKDHDFQIKDSEVDLELKLSNGNHSIEAYCNCTVTKEPNLLSGWETALFSCSHPLWKGKDLGRCVLSILGPEFSCWTNEKHWEEDADNLLYQWL